MNYFKKSSFWFWQFLNKTCGGVKPKLSELEKHKKTPQKNGLDSNQE